MLLFITHGMSSPFAIISLIFDCSSGLNGDGEPDSASFSKLRMSDPELICLHPNLRRGVRRCQINRGAARH